MSAVANLVIAGLKWEPQIKGALYVALAVLILMGSCYLLLATNMGARLGFLLAAAGVFGWLSTLGVIWWCYARGPVGPDPSWRSQGIVAGALAGAGNPALNEFPQHWAKLEPTDKEVADATPAAEGVLTATGGPFKASSDYVIIQAYQKGGKSHGVLGINIRPLDLWHTPHYLVVEVQKAMTVTPEGGGKAVVSADPGAQPVSVVLLRNQGARRLHPAVFSISCMTLFGLFCYQLHTRDKEAMARRAAEVSGAGRLQPVSR